MPYDMGMMAVIIGCRFVEPFEIPVRIVARRHLVALTSFIRTEIRMMEEKAVFLNRYIEAARFVANTGQN